MSNPSSNDPNANYTETATVYQSHSEVTHAQSLSNHNFNKSYPPAEAKYDEIAQNPDFFLLKLKGFHDSFGTKFKVPTIGGRALDLYHLFLEVTSRGGIEKVIRDRKWKEVISVFNFPSTITSASFVIRKYYLSLLYHFEQVYYFQKEIPSISLDDPGSGIAANGSDASHLFENDTPTHQLAVDFVLEPGSSVTGTIDGKFDNGYLITVNLGSETLNGVLYHTPVSQYSSQNSNNSAVPPHRNHKSYQLALTDPSRPKAHRSGYNFFFSEHYNRLKPLYHGQEKEITKKIGVLWSRLTDDEKQGSQSLSASYVISGAALQVYQEKGLRDKERYRSEMLEYRASNNPKSQ
ncbi:High mobility group B protein [Actinidia chinensis var. chinensis]|uniref:High mobility group B protein n=1 Tax=Actinidia chinensis var. chinensis TaxID=1590841 RepID=A0A2R6PQA2_ACTCC|nr:High mobility group B protein [Actinidia chinensis var. chinensis]